MNARTKEAMFSLNDELNSSCDLHPMISVNRSDLETVIKHLHRSGGEWNNQAALGYAIVAAKSAGFRSPRIEDIVNGMRREFDSKSLEDAAEIYRKSHY